MAAVAANLEASDDPFERGTGREIVLYTKKSGLLVFVGFQKLAPKNLLKT